MPTQGKLRRDGMTPMYVDYVSNYGLVDGDNFKQENWPDPVKQFRGLEAIKIPSFQRKLVWGVEQVKKLIDTKSELLGTAILATIDGESETFLVDGLQRISTGTILLLSIYDPVLSPSPSNPTAAVHFQTLATQFAKFEPIWKHNDNVLTNHSRVGIRTSYAKLRDELSEYILDELATNPKKLSDELNRILLSRQVAVDPYRGFLGVPELLNTFLDLNSTGVTLSKIDLLRARLIEQANACNWSDNIIDEFENDFTTTFQPDKATQTIAGTLATNIYKSFEDSEKDIQNVFPNWANITKDFFDDFFNYISNFIDAAKEKQANQVDWKWPYLAEIDACGKLPFCVILWYYWKNFYTRFLKTKNQFDPAKIPQILSDHNRKKELEFERDRKDDGIIAPPSPERLEEIKQQISKIEESEEDYPGLFDDLPDFLGGNLNTIQDRWLFLRASYRRLFDGSIGRSGHVLDDILQNNLATIREISDEMNPESNSNSIDTPISELWIKGQFTKKIKKTEAKRVFNACLLPDTFAESPSKQGEGDGGLVYTQPSDLSFEPFFFGIKQGSYHIDHLIPASELDKAKPGFDVGNERIVNFAPLESNLNIIAKNTPCSNKLIQAPGTPHIYQDVSQKHPYCKWLIGTDHAGKYSPSDLDKQEELLETKDIHDTRFDTLFQILSKKL